MTNSLLEAANERLRKAGHKRGLLLLFDNMDRFDPANIKAVLLEGSTLIRRMACHAVFTMPINLHYQSDSPYQDSYDSTAVVLPMPAIRKRGERWADTVVESPFDDRAVEQLLAALKKRINLNFFSNKDDARLIAKLSGGCMRDLLHLVTLARQKSVPAKRLTPEGVHHAILSYRGVLTDGLLEADYERLARVALGEAGADHLDDILRGLLKRRIVFKYCVRDDRWYDVHPLVIETEGFRRAKQKASRLAPG
jgi:hypothetical protein